jgi:methyltransferase family protein
MKNFVRHFVVPCACRFGWKSFCEVGAMFGGSTDELLKLPLTRYTIIDPCIDENLDLKYSSDERVTVMRSISLEALASNRIPESALPFDCILIDGDHNWYTVFNELSLIRERGLLRPGGFIFFHDVAWPYGRRDMYYQPETIPAEFRHPHAYKGLVRGQNELAVSGGDAAHLANALIEGGPRNGVLTGIEDFLKLHPREYQFCVVGLQFGLGILQFRSGAASSGLHFLSIRFKAFAYTHLGRQASAIMRVIRGG